MITWAKQLLDHAATYPDAAIWYYASGMILKQHSDASYNNDEKAHSSYGGYAWLGWKQPDNALLRLNGAILVDVNILQLVAASAAEAELGGLFKNIQQGTIMQLTLQ